jgi:putative ABC transport system permease protein
MGGSILSGIPYTWDEGLIVLLSVSVLLLLVIFISVIKKIGVGKEFTYAIAKGGAQLFVIAIFLTILFDFELWYILIWVLLVTMIVVSGYTSAKRATNMPKAYQITTPAILIGSTLVLVVLAVSRAMPLQPQFIVPLAGMVFGNSMAICSISLERLIREIRVNINAIETALSLGATGKQAMEEYSRFSIRASLIPTIDRLKTLGIIFIPGAMAGLLIAGTDPRLAAEYQIIVFLMIVGGGIVTALLVTYLSRKRIFNEAEQVSDWVYQIKK